MTNQTKIFFPSPNQIHSAGHCHYPNLNTLRIKPTKSLQERQTQTTKIFDPPYYDNIFLKLIIQLS